MKPLPRTRTGRIAALLAGLLAGASLAIAAPTTDLSGLKSTSHSSNGVSSTNNQITMSWTAAAGIKGYAHLFTTKSAVGAIDLPSVTLSPSATTVTSSALADGTWYFHIQAIATDGTRGTIYSAGPFVINTTPQVSSVSPTSASNAATANLTINGSNFIQGATVKVGTTTLSGVTFVNSNKLTATVPANLPAKSYDVTVTNPNGKQGSKAGAFTVTTANAAPTAVAKTTLPNNTGTVPTAGGKLRVTLDASASTDSDGVVNSYSWALDQYSSPAVDAYGLPQFSSTSAQKPTIDLYSGTYLFGLVVTDNKGKQSARATVKVTINEPNNAAPTAKITTPAVKVLPGDTITLSGTQSSDPEGKPLQYQWVLSKPTASNAVLANATSSTTSFTADTYGNFGVTLTVTDTGGLTDVYSVVITSAVGDVYAAKTTVTAGGDIYADGSTTTITVVPRDKNGNHLGKGQTVALQLRPASLGTLGKVALAADGYSYQATLTAPTGVGGQVTISATVNGVTINNYATVRYLSYGLDKTKSRLTLPTHTILTGKTLRVTVVPTDKYGTPLDGNHVVQVIDSYGTANDNYTATPLADGSFIADLTAPANPYTGAVIHAKVDGTLIDAYQTIDVISATANTTKPLTLTDLQGNTIAATAGKSVRPGTSIALKVGGGQGQLNYSVSGPATSGVITTNGDTYTFTAPSSGSFGGKYTITITDPVTNNSKTATVVVPYKAESAGRVLLTSNSGGMVVNLYGAALNDTFDVSVVDSAGKASTAVGLSMTTIRADINGKATVTVTPASSTVVSTPTPLFVRFTAAQTAYGPAPVNDVPIMLVPAQTITLTITNKKTTKPVPLAKVELVRPVEFATTVTADKYGSATLSLPKLAAADLVVTSGTTFSPYRFTLKPGTTKATVQLSPITSGGAITLAGTITNPYGFTGIRVAAVDAYGNLVPGSVATGDTFTIVMDGYSFTPVAVVAGAKGAKGARKAITSPGKGNTLNGIALTLDKLPVVDPAKRTEAVGLLDKYGTALNLKPAANTGEVDFGNGYKAKVFAKPTGTAKGSLKTAAFTPSAKTPAVMPILDANGKIIDVVVRRNRPEDAYAQTAPLPVGTDTDTTIDLYSANNAIKVLKSVGIRIPANAFKGSVGQVFTQVTAAAIPQTVNHATYAQATGGELAEIDLTVLDATGNPYSTAKGNNLINEIPVTLPLDRQTLINDGYTTAGAFDPAKVQAAIDNGSLVVWVADSIQDFIDGYTTALDPVANKIVFNGATDELEFVMTHFSAVGAGGSTSTTTTSGSTTTTTGGGGGGGGGGGTTSTTTSSGGGGGKGCVAPVANAEELAIFTAILLMLGLVMRRRHP